MNSLECFLRNGLEVSHLPVCVEGIGRRHAIPHYRVQESLALTRVEAKDLMERGREGGRREGGERGERDETMIYVVAEILT